jgi:ABC-2 type transport system permease protein
MKNALIIALNHLNNLRKDRLALAFMFILPLLLAFVTGLAFGGGSSSGTYVIPVAVVELDGGAFGARIAAVFDQEPFARRDVGEEEAATLLQERAVSATVIVPANATDLLQSGQRISLSILQTVAQEGPRMVEQHLNAELSRIRAAAAAASLVSQNGIQDWQTSFAAAYGVWALHEDPVKVSVDTLGTAPVANHADGYNLSSPGYMVMFGLMSITAAGAALILRERESGTLSRLLSAPLSRGQLILGKMLGLILTGTVQASVLAAASGLLFGVSWGTSPLTLLVIIVAFSFAAAGLGMFLAALCKSASQASAVGVLTVLVLSMLGGIWWPMELMPRQVQLISRLVPSGWAMAAFTDIIVRGASLGQLWVHTAVLAAFGAVFATLGVRFFRYH